MDFKYYFCIIVFVMIHTSLIPEHQDLSIQIHVPIEYIGKRIEVLLYAHDEANEGRSPVQRPISNFRGALKLTDTQYNDFQDFVKKGREE